MKRPVRNFIVCFLGIVCCLLLGTALLTGTTSGSKWLIKKLAGLSPTPIGFAAVEGRLADHLVLHKLHVSLDGETIEIADLALDWSPWTIPWRTVTVHQLEISRLSRQTADSGGSSADNETLHLNWPMLPPWLEPWRARIDTLLIREVIQQGPTHSVIQARDIAANLLLESGQLVIDNLTGSSNAHHLQGNLQLGLNAPSLKAWLRLDRHGKSELEQLTLALDLHRSQDDSLLSGPLQLSVAMVDQLLHHLAGDLHVAPDRLELNELALTRDHLPGTVAGHLAADWSTRAFKLAAELDLHGWALSAGQEISPVLDGRITASGSREEQSGQFDLAATGTGWQQGQVSGSWSGQSDRIQATIQSGEWLGGEVSGSLLTTWGEQAATRLSLVARRLDPSRLDDTWSGSVNLTAGVDLVTVEGTPQVKFGAAITDSLLREVPLHGKVQGLWHHGQLELDALDLQGDGFLIKAHGALADHLKLQLAISDLGGLLPQARGSLHGSGWLSLRDHDWRAEFTAHADKVHYRDLSLDNAKLLIHPPASGTPAILRLDAVSAGVGSVQLEGLQASLQGGLDKHDLAVSFGMGEGRTNLALSGQRSDLGWAGFLTRFDIDHAHARRWTLREPASIQIDQQAVTIEQFHLTGDTGKLAFAGRIGRDGRPLRLDLSAERFPLQTLDPLFTPWGATGNIYAEMSCGTQECRVRADGLDRLTYEEQTLDVDNFAIDSTWTADGLSADLALDLNDAGQVSVSLASPTPWRWQLPQAGRLELVVDKLAPDAWPGPGTASQLRGALSAKASADWNRNRPQRIEIDIEGSLEWRGNKRKPLPLQLVMNGHWHNDGLRVDADITTKQQGHLVLQASSAAPPQWGPPASVDWAAHWSGMPLLGDDLAPPPLSVQGLWNGHAEGSLNGNLAFRSSGRAEAAGGRLSWHDEDGAEIDVKLEAAAIDWRWQDERLDGELTLELAENGRLSAQWQLPIPARLPLVPRSRDNIQGRITASILDNGLLGLFLPEVVQKTHGEISIDAALGGTWQQPILSGSAQLLKTGGYLPAPGIHLENLSLNARLEKERLQLTDLAVQSGSGQLSGAATIDLQGWRPTNLDANLSGENFTLIHLPELQVHISPDLKLTGNAKSQSLTGDIRIPYFLATGRSERTPVPASPDVVLVDAIHEEPKALPMQMTTRVRLLLGDQVLVKLFGLDARLGGQLELTGIDQQHFSGQGEVHIEEGAYSTYGVKLNIDKGRAVFAGGPLDNPAIDILALRKIGEISAGVLIRGTAKKPEAKLYSEPAMADTETLSYIVLGRPISQAGGETDPLMLAAGTLLSAGDSAVLRNRLQNQLGIDTLDVSSDSGQTTDTALRLGKYLTPDIYLSYGYSLFNSQSEIGLRYRFLQNWEAESKFGVESGADLYYRFEFD